MAVDSAYVAFRCSECNVVIFEDCELPAFDLTSETRHDGAGTETCHIICPQCGKSHELIIVALDSSYWEIEYCSGHTNPSVMLNVPPYLESEEEFELSLESIENDDPYRIYLRSSSGLHALIGSHLNNERLAQAQIRMVYANYVAILEAYLCDRLVSLVTYCEASLRKFMNSHKEIGSKPISLQAVLGNPDIVLQKVNGYLNNCLYHKIDVVAKLYRDAFGLEVFLNSDSKAAIQNAVTLRHDIVHRNGRGKDGRMVRIDDKMVKELGVLIGRFVFDTESRLDNLIRMRAFYEFESQRPQKYDGIDFDDVDEEDLLAASTYKHMLP